jgi:hypothetical protein
MTASFLRAAAILVAGASLIGSADAQDRTQYAGPHEELPAGHTTAQVDARTALMRRELHLTAEQEAHWTGFESAMRDYFKNQAERTTAMRADRSLQDTPADVIERMRSAAKFMSQGAANENTLAEAAQPLFASLNNQQKQRFTDMMLFGNELDLN